MFSEWKWLTLYLPCIAYTLYIAVSASLPLHTIIRNMCNPPCTVLYVLAQRASAPKLEVILLVSSVSRPAVVNISWCSDHLRWPGHKANADHGLPLVEKITSGYVRTCVECLVASVGVESMLYCAILVYT